MPLLGLHRRCGCDCRDSDQYEVDSLIYNPLFDIGCGSGVKPPCKYLVRFECNVIDPKTTLIIAEINMPMRQLCEFGPLGQYVAILSSFSNSTSYSQTEFPGNQRVGFGTQYSTSAPYACTWAERFVAYSQLSDPAGWWANNRASIGWTLNTVSRTITDPLGNVTIITADLTHTTGITYRLTARSNWDCFGPNTVYLQDAATWQARYPGLPAFVCITPEITTFVYKVGCAQNCWQAQFPQVDATFDHIPAQRLDFIPFDPLQSAFAGYQTNRGICNYAARLIHYVSRQPNQGGVEDANEQTVTYAGGTPLSTNIPQLPCVVQLSVMSPMDSGQSVVARLFVYYLPTSNVGGVATLVYECDNFVSGGGSFSVLTSATGFPRVITLTSHKCVSSEVNDQGLCPSGHCQDPRYPLTRPVVYAAEADRLRCCDPWCACAPGTIKIICTGLGGTQVFGNCLVRDTFCTGGRTGTSGPVGPSREFCVAAIATDGSSHTVCAVAYCSGTAWKIDWYCDGTFQSTTLAVITCCPFTLKANMPTMSCLPGCTGCLAINTQPDCSAVATFPCCDTSTMPTTLTAHVVSTCLGTFNITLTKGTFSGHVAWIGSGVSPDANSDELEITFIADTSPCQLRLRCNNSIFTVFLVDVTVVSCSPPSYTASWTYAGIGCGIICMAGDVTLFSIS